MLNLTNDAWFGLTPGPYQHFAQARMRAVEEGLPLVRAANTGISAIVDPMGRIVASHDLGQEGLVDGPLPKPLQTVSVAAKLDHILVPSLLAVALALASVPLCGCNTRRG
jgi:apolipoprotein N-acyltransferase